MRICLMMAAVFALTWTASAAGRDQPTAILVTHRLNHCRLYDCGVLETSETICHVGWTRLNNRIATKTAATCHGTKSLRDSLLRRTGLRERG